MKHVVASHSNTRNSHHRAKLNTQQNNVLLTVPEIYFIYIIYRFVKNLKAKFYLSNFAFKNQTNKNKFTTEMNWTCLVYSLEFLKYSFSFFLSPYILCNFVPIELQEMCSRNFIQKIISTTVILSNFTSVAPFRAYLLFWKLKDLK